MNNFVTKVAIFAVGAVIGSAVTWQLTKKKYEQIAQEEIDSVTEVFEKKLSEKPEKPSLSISAKLDPETAKFLEEKQEHIDKVFDLGYVSESEEKGEPTTMSKPYVISPDEFDELTDAGYDAIYLTYYADEVLADDMDDIVDNVDEVVGYESLKHFGDYGEDCVHVRNDELKADYEITLDTRNYRDLVDIPHSVEE